MNGRKHSIVDKFMTKPCTMFVFCLKMHSLGYCAPMRIYLSKTWWCTCFSTPIWHVWAYLCLLGFKVLINPKVKSVFCLYFYNHRFNLQVECALWQPMTWLCSTTMQLHGISMYAWLRQGFGEKNIGKWGLNVWKWRYHAWIEVPLYYKDTIVLHMHHGTT